MTALIPAADLQPTAELIATERERFARCANYGAARDELSVAMVHIEALAAALAAGHILAAAIRVQAMLAVRRAYDERVAELDAAAEARTAARKAVPA